MVKGFIKTLLFLYNENNMPSNTTPIGIRQQCKVVKLGIIKYSFRIIFKVIFIIIGVDILGWKIFPKKLRIGSARLPLLRCTR